MHHGSTVFKENVRGSSLREISGYKFVIGCSNGTMMIYSYENPKKIEKIY